MAHTSTTATAKRKVAGRPEIRDVATASLANQLPFGREVGDVKPIAQVSAHQEYPCDEVFRLDPQLWLGRRDLRPGSRSGPLGLRARIGLSLAGLLCQQEATDHAVAIAKSKGVEAFIFPWELRSLSV
jgi:hypothetical protein